MARNAAWGALALLLLSASLGIASAQSEAGASIISTTTMVFRLEGNATGNFSTTMQKTFSDQLRALLQNYNFMSVAVSDYVVRFLGSTTGRLVLRLDAHLQDHIHICKANSHTGVPRICVGTDVQ